jgi:hypothetical protein
LDPEGDVGSVDWSEVGVEVSQETEDIASYELEHGGAEIIQNQGIDELDAESVQQQIGSLANRVAGDTDGDAGTTKNGFKVTIPNGSRGIQVRVEPKGIDGKPY